MPPRPVRRQVSYHWRLRELMAARGLFNATDLEPLLAERGISLSSVQVWRLVTQVPERLSLQVLAALCDILEASPADLITTTADSAAALPKVAAADAPVDPGALRPRRATLKPQAE
jgi:DNA-binding Xre family transcriptional regulator